MALATTAARWTLWQTISLLASWAQAAPSTYATSFDDSVLAPDALEPPEVEVQEPSGILEERSVAMEDEDKKDVYVTREHRHKQSDGTIVKEVVSVANVTLANENASYGESVSKKVDRLLESREHVFNAVAKNVRMDNHYDQAFNSTQESKKPFIKVTRTKTHMGTTALSKTTVHIVTPSAIVSVYLVMFIPLLIAWFAHLYSGLRIDQWPFLLPLTLLVTTVGMDFANQSLAAVVGGPNLLTAVQSWALAFATGVWTLMYERKEISSADPQALWVWLLAALAFTVTQLVNHLAYWQCSLYERVIFLNLCPVATVFIEQFAMPAGLKPSLPLWNKGGICVTLLGAFLFGFPARENSGSLSVAISSLLMISMVLCRLTQRVLLTKNPTLPVGLLACTDGLLLGVTSTTLALPKLGQHISEGLLHTWLSEPSVCILLVVSSIAFIGFHVTVLLILRQTSASNALFFANLANLTTVTLGVRFLGDSEINNTLLTPAAFIGLAVCIFGAMWYAAEAFHPSRRSNVGSTTAAATTPP